MYFMTFKMKPDNMHTISTFATLGECLSFRKKCPILMETDSYSTFVGDCIAGAVNDISVLQSPHKVLR